MDAERKGGREFIAWMQLYIDRIDRELPRVTFSGEARGSIQQRASKWKRAGVGVALSQNPLSQASIRDFVLNVSKKKKSKSYK